MVRRRLRLLARVCRGARRQRHSCDAALRPPAIVYIFIPTVALVAFLARSRAGAVVASSIPVAVLMGAESFRLIVELFLERLWHAGRLPQC